MQGWSTAVFWYQYNIYLGKTNNLSWVNFHIFFLEQWSDIEFAEWLLFFFFFIVVSILRVTTGIKQIAFEISITCYKGFQNLVDLCNYGCMRYRDSVYFTYPITNIHKTYLYYHCSTGENSILQGAIQCTELYTR